MMARTPHSRDARRSPLDVPLRGVLGTGALTGLLLFAGSLIPSAAMAQRTPQETIANWPATPKKVAMEMMDKYGPPNETTASMLIWHNNGPWKRTIVYRTEVPHRFPMPHTDLLEQFIDYRVLPHRFDDLAMYDGSVIVERTKGEISARCDKEAANFLALNLANDVVSGKRTVDGARRFYAQTMMAFMKGKKHPYTQGLQFRVPKGNTNDPDKALMKK